MGWQAGRIEVPRGRLAVEWTNRYGGAHVDVDGAEQWLLDPISLRQLGFGRTEPRAENPATELKWFKEARSDCAYGCRGCFVVRMRRSGLLYRAYEGLRFITSTACNASYGIGHDHRATSDATG